MTLKENVLYELLNSDSYISGEQLAKKFDKSRAAVWKAIKALIKDGYNIDAVTNKGYMLIYSNNLVSVQKIKAQLDNDIDVIHLTTVDSTNNYCKRMLADGKQGEFLVVADEQSAGRGRQGKSFYSPAQNGIYFSLVLRPYDIVQNVVTATTAASVAVCKSIEKLTDKKPKIKWVNDVYLDDKKICGILTEAITNFEEGVVDSVIVGIGVNINPSDFPSYVENAGCLDTDIDKSLLIADICNELKKIAVGDYRSFIDYYRNHSLVIGEKIKFIKDGRVTAATAVAIDDAGGLVVKTENGEQQILRSGQISIRRI